MSQFIDTPFNRDCAHRGLYFAMRPDRCPYCHAPSHAARARRVVLWRDRVLFLLVLCAVLYFYWRG